MLRSPTNLGSIAHIEIDGGYGLRDKGLITRLRESNLEQEAQRTAEAKLTTAANGEGKLVELAEESTRAMLNGLFRGLGYTEIEINFDESPSGRT